jgi:DNA repair photolyase
MSELSAAGVRVVARIEPYLFLLTDDLEEVEKYMEDVWNAGVRHITFDTYSYPAQNQEFVRAL